MKRRIGFTLVELLVVIAIISILAAIVVPNVADWILRAQMAEAVSEIESIDLAFTKMLGDAGRNSASQLFDPTTLAKLQEADLQYNSKVLYELMRQGRNADAGLLPEVKAKLGTQYLDLNEDPWDSLYNFFPGPWRRVPDPANPDQFLDNILLRSYRVNQEQEDQGVDRFDPDYVPYTYTQEALPGDPDPDGLPGFPAPKEKSFYIWSNGQNLTSDQLFSETPGFSSVFVPDAGHRGGGDDINSWDTKTGWSGFYG